MFNALTIAHYFLSKTDSEEGDLISNLKLQKLLYYAQGFHLAMSGKPLFKEEIEAWKHGPVVPEVYRHFKHHKDGQIPPVPSSAKIINPGTTRFLDEIYRIMGQFSAWKLRNLTHDEAPWSNTILGDVISHKALRDYFKTRLA